MFSLKKNIIQIQCQIKSFKIQSKIFVILISLFFISCDFENNKKNNDLKKIYDVKFDRFEKNFFQSNDGKFRSKHQGGTKKTIKLA